MRWPGTGALSAAARTLAVTHATISRRIQSLELTLGHSLVERRPDGYVLTPAGTQALAAASEMEAAAAKLSRGGTDDSPRGLVRINAPPSLTQSFLVAPLATLAVQHPSLDIDVASDFKLVSLERRETDIALRFGRPNDGDVIAKFLVGSMQARSGLSGSGPARRRRSSVSTKQMPRCRRPYGLHGITPARAWPSEATASSRKLRPRVRAPALPCCRTLYWT